MPKSVLRLCVDKDQGLRSRKLVFTSLVLPSNECFKEERNFSRATLKTWTSNIVEWMLLF